MHLRELYNAFSGASLFLAFLVLVVLSSFYNYLLFHTLAEFYSILIAWLMFVITYNLRDKIDNGYLIVIGISYLFVGVIDLIHTLAYKGMNIFTGFDANLPTQLWIAARYLERIAFLVAFFFVDRKLKFSLVFSVFLAVTAGIFASIFLLRNFPDCYIEGKGPTSFKIYSEYIICLILAMSYVVLMKHKRDLDKITLRYLQLGVITTILAELSFTKYVSVYGIFNLIGHVFKIISFYFIYKALAKRILLDPFSTLWKKLKDRERELNTYIELIDGIFVVINKDQNIALINEKGAELLGYKKEELIGKNWFDLAVPEEDRESAKNVFDNVIVGNLEIVGYYENSIVTKNGEKRIYAWYNSVMEDSEKNRIATVSIGHDITEERTHDESRERLIKELQASLDKIKVLQGLLPICAWCKRIRTDDGYWMQLEAYIAEHTNAEFTHGICPECYEKVKKEMEKAK